MELIQRVTIDITVHSLHPTFHMHDYKLYVVDKLYGRRYVWMLFLQAYKLGMYGRRYVYNIMLFLQAFKLGMYGGHYVWILFLQAYKLGMYGGRYVWVLFLQAYKLGMYGSRYVWMLLGWYTERWWTVGNNTNCTHQQLAEAVNGYFAVDSLNYIIDDGKSLSGLVSKYQ